MESKAATEIRRLMASHKNKMKAIMDPDFAPPDQEVREFMASQAAREGRHYASGAGSQAEEVSQTNRLIKESTGLKLKTIQPLRSK